jgi:hypothetical protein
MNFIRNAIIAGGLAVSASSFAQMGGMPNTDYMPIIFLNPAVAKDMHLSPDVAQKETSVIMQNAMAMMPALMDKSGGSSHNEKMAAAAMAGYQKMSEASLAPLNSAQRVRYRQLTLQFFGAAALVQPKVAKTVGITESQKSKLTAAFRETSKGMAAKAQSMQSGGAGAMSGLGGISGMMSQSREAADRKAKVILTAGQWAKWTALQGKKLPGIDNIFGGLGGGGGMGFGG